MRPFTHLEAIAAPLPVANVDTDMIVPAAFLKTVSRKGLARALFARERFDAQGAERTGFILNMPPWREAGILVTLDNFGCGSSREHAPWALLDFGITCIFAPSFADIFHANCCKNGILPVEMDREVVSDLLLAASDPATALMKVDLRACTLEIADGRSFQFDIDPLKRERLLAGQDDIGASLAHADAISKFESHSRIAQPWNLEIPAIP